MDIDPIKAWRPRRKEGEWGEGPALAITTMVCSEFAEVHLDTYTVRKSQDSVFCMFEE
jgi:hypothetical protein